MGLHALNKHLGKYKFKISDSELLLAQSAGAVKHLSFAQ